MTSREIPIEFVDFPDAEVGARIESVMNTGIRSFAA
jgi:hypothetical protein